MKRLTGPWGICYPSEHHLGYPDNYVVSYLFWLVVEMLFLPLWARGANSISSLGQLHEMPVLICTESQSLCRSLLLVLCADLSSLVLSPENSSLSGLLKLGSPSLCLGFPSLCCSLETLQAVNNYGALVACCLSHRESCLSSPDTQCPENCCLTYFSGLKIKVCKLFCKHLLCCFSLLHSVPQWILITVCLFMPLKRDD